jgi:hypothetical protein
MGAQGVRVCVGVCAHYDKKPVSQLQIFLSKSGKNIFWSIFENNFAQFRKRYLLCSHV